MSQKISLKLEGLARDLSTLCYSDMMLIGMGLQEALDLALKNEVEIAPHYWANAMAQMSEDILNAVKKGKEVADAK